MTTHEIVTLDSTIVYQNRWMAVREDAVRRNDGSIGLFGVVDKVDYSLIVPFDGTHVHLVEQYRYPVRGRFWELPQGSWENDADTDAVTVARGELEEETGLRAGSMIELGVLFQAYGYSNQSVHVFLATELEGGDQSLERSERGLVTATFPVELFRSMTLDGTVRDISTVAAAHLFFDHRSRHPDCNSVASVGSPTARLLSRRRSLAPGRDRR